MPSKPKYTQEISKLSQSSTRLKEQVAGRMLHYWKEDLKGGKSKICAVFVDGQTFQDVLIGEHAQARPAIRATSAVPVPLVAHGSALLGRVLLAMLPPASWKRYLSKALSRICLLYTSPSPRD